MSCFCVSPLKSKQSKNIRISLLKFNNLKKKLNFCEKVSKVKFIIKKTKNKNNNQFKNIGISLLKLNNMRKKIKFVKIYWIKSGKIKHKSVNKKDENVNFRII